MATIPRISVLRRSQYYKVSLFNNYKKCKRISKSYYKSWILPHACLLANKRHCAGHCVPRDLLRMDWGWHFVIAHRKITVSLLLGSEHLVFSSIFIHYYVRSRFHLFIFVIGRPLTKPTTIGVVQLAYTQLSTIFHVNGNFSLHWLTFRCSPISRII